MQGRSVLGGFFGAWERAELGCAAAGMLMIGGCFLMCGALLTWRSAALTFDSIRAQGEVVRHLERPGTDDKKTPTYAPVVRFTLEDGRSIEFTSAYSSSRREYRRGDRVPVVYRPSTGEAEIWSFGRLWLFPAASLTAAVVLLGLAALALWTARR
jgi:hypothetical protein